MSNIDERQTASSEKFLHIFHFVNEYISILKEIFHVSLWLLNDLGISENFESQKLQ